MNYCSLDEADQEPDGTGTPANNNARIAGLNFISPSTRTTSKIKECHGTRCC